MRAVRLAIAALIGMALAVLPTSMAFAAPPAGQAEMWASVPGDDVCPCCDVAQHRGAGICKLKCCCAFAILVEREPLIGPRLEMDGDVAAAVLSPRSTRPDPPPPRS